MATKISIKPESSTIIFSLIVQVIDEARMELTRPVRRPGASVGVLTAPWARLTPSPSFLAKLIFAALRTSVTDADLR